MEVSKIETGVKLLLPIIEESYHQEQNALSKWDNKADNITRYVSIYFVLVNLLVSILKTKSEIGIKMQNFGGMDYLLILCPVIISLFLAIIGQALSRVGFLPDAKTLFTEIEKHLDQFKTEEDICEYKLMAYDELISILRKNNRYKCICVLSAYIMYFISLIIFIVEMYYNIL